MPTEPATTVTAAELLPELAPAAAAAAPAAPATPPPAAESAQIVSPGTLDRKGTPYDPARHIPKMKASTGGWMPRGGRKPAHATAPQSPAATPAPAPAPAAPLPPLPEIGPDEPATPAPDATGEKPPAAATDTGKAAEPARPAGPDVSVTHETAAELAARATYAVTGVIINDHKKATATGAEHDTLKKGYASFFAHRNLVLVGGIALAAVVVAYLLGEARREEVVCTVKKIFTKKPAPRPVVELDPAPAAPATPPPASASPAGTPRPSRVDSW